MALGVPNGGAFGPPAPRSTAGGIRPSRPPTFGNTGRTRAAPGFNNSMGATRPDRMGRRPGGGSFPTMKSRPMGVYPLGMYPSPPAGRNPMLYSHGAAAPLPQYSGMSTSGTYDRALNSSASPGGGSRVPIGPLPPPGAQGQPLSMESLGLTAPSYASIPPRF